MHELVKIVAQYFIIFPVLICLIVWLKFSVKLKKEFILFALIGVVITLVLAKIGSKLFYDPRPFIVGHFTPYFMHGNDNGFPSDHTLLASFLGFVLLRYNKRLAGVVFVLALLIGLARVVAGVHHLIDIIGAICFAGIGVYAAHLIITKITTRSRKDLNAADTPVSH